MAGKTRKSPAPWTIEKIKAGLIVNRLEKHIFATAADLELHMTPSQVTAALGLLKKVHPDLANQQVKGEIDHQISIKWQK